MATESGSETLVQNQSLKKSNRVTFLDNRTLRIDSEYKNKKTSYRIDVIALKVKHRHRVTFAWPWLAAAVILFALLLAEISYSFMFPAEPAWLAIAGEIAIGILSVICLAVFIKSSQGKYVFKSRHAKVPLLDIWSGQPSGKAVKAFVKLVEQRIDNAHNHMNLTKEQQITGEIKMLRRLMEENILQASDYEAARARLMKKF